MSVHFNQRLPGMPLSINKGFLLFTMATEKNPHLLELWAGQCEAEKALDNVSWYQVILQRMQARYLFSGFDVIRTTVIPCFSDGLINIQPPGLLEPSAACSMS